LKTCFMLDLTAAVLSTSMIGVAWTAGGLHAYAWAAAAGHLLAAAAALGLAASLLASGWARTSLLPPMASSAVGVILIVALEPLWAPYPPLARLAAWYFARDWIAGLAVLVLWAAWRYLPHEDEPPVIAMAFTFQWLQVTIGVFYHGFTGRSLDAVALSDYRPMVLIGLGCLVALLL